MVKFNEVKKFQRIIVRQEQVLEKVQTILSNGIKEK
jgi:hypothetical protein